MEVTQMVQANLADLVEQLFRPEVEQAAGDADGRPAKVRRAQLEYRGFLEYFVSRCTRSS